MEGYKVLGVDENASMEDVKRAYKKKVDKLKEEVQDERRARAFIRILDKAYEDIKGEREENQNQQTVVINSKDIDFNNYSTHELVEDNTDEYEERFMGSKDKKKSSSRNTSTKKSKSSRKKSRENDNRKRDKRTTSKKETVKEREKASSLNTLIQLPFKILALPIIALLSIVIFLCKIIKLISWVAAKLIIVAAIAVSAIHGYQIYMGQAVQYEIFVLSGVGFVVSLFLPSILKVVPSILGGVNNKLKKFVF